MVIIHSQTSIEVWILYGFNCMIQHELPTSNQAHPIDNPWARSAAVVSKNSQDLKRTKRIWIFWHISASVHQSQAPPHSLVSSSHDDRNYHYHQTLRKNSYTGQLRHWYNRSYFIGQFFTAGVLVPDLAYLTLYAVAKRQRRVNCLQADYILLLRMNAFVEPTTSIRWISMNAGVTSRLQQRGFSSRPNEMWSIPRPCATTLPLFTLFTCESDISDGCHPLMLFFWFQTAFFFFCI